MKNLKKLTIAAVLSAFVLPFVNISSAVAGEGYRGLSIGLVGNDMDLLAKGHEIEGVNSDGGTIGANYAADDMTGYKEEKSFSFPSAFIEYSTGTWLSFTGGLEYIEGSHALTKKSRTDSADANTDGNDSDHGERTAVAEVTDLFTVYLEPGIMINDYIGFYGKVGGTHMTLDITQTDTVSDAISTYKDRDVWGAVYGGGIKLRSPWGVFLKVEQLETRFTSMDWQSGNNRVNARTEMSSTRFSLGYNF